MKIQPLVLGIGYTNSYIVYSEDKDAYIIDAPDGTGAIVSFIAENGLRVKAILLTHGHYDHILGLPELKAAYPKASIYLDKNDSCFLQDGGKANLELLSGDRAFLKHFEKAFSALPNDYLNYEEKIGPFTVLRTPGHTMGSISLYSEDENVLFSGDTLFKYSVGRCDLGGNYSALLSSLEYLKTLPERTKVFPGHGEFTSIKEEKLHNPYL